ncbi:MAG: hypothetical protein ABSC18_04410 [Verrucomicrobiota bacterium]
MKPVRFLDKAITVHQIRRPTPAHCRRGGAVLGCGLLLLGFLGGGTGALAQGVLAPPSEPYERQAASQTLTTNQNGGIPPLAGAAVQAPGPFQLGPLDFHPHLLYRFIYGDGIPTGPTNHYKTVIQEISPGLSLYWGSHWTLDYTPTLRMYSSKEFPDATDESVVLSGKTSYQDWGLSLSQVYSSSSAPLVETEALTEVENYLTVFQASRQLGSQLSAQLGLNQSFRFSSEGTISQDVRQWIATAGLNDQFWSRFGAGFNASAGYDLITPGANMAFEQAQGTMNWRVKDKLNMTASAGLEVTQLLGAEMINPIFNGSLVYRPWEQTAASLTASRAVTPSFYANDVVVNTSLSATLQQRLLRYLTFEISGGYTTTPFIGFAAADEFTAQTPTRAPAAIVQQNREDYSRFVRVSVASAFRKRGTVSVFYSYSDYTSGLAAYALTSTQVGLEIGWRY